MTLNTVTPEAVQADPDSGGAWNSSAEGNAPAHEEAPAVAASVDVRPPTTRLRKTAGKKARLVELTLTVIGNADGEWRADLKQGASYLARDVAVAAAAVSRAARELHDDLSSPIDAIIDDARSQHAAKIAALEAELDAARRAFADLD